MNRIIVRLVVVILFTAAVAAAQENILLVTYGPAALAQEGDDDFKQIIFLQIPESLTDSLYLRVFDIDCGDEVDLAFAGWNTETRFTLYGGAGAVSTATLQSPFPSAEALAAGVVLKSETFGGNPLLNNEWHNFIRLLPASGEKIGGSYFFKLVVQGAQGNDANVFDLRLSQSASQNTPPPGVKMYTYAPTIRLTKQQAFASVKFFAPQGMPEITIFNFDLAGAEVSFETALRSNLLVTSSGQGEWVKNKILLEKLETGRACAVAFGQGGENPNDATFYVTDDHGQAVVIDLPIYVGKPNHRPAIQKKVLPLSDCYSMVFDAKESTDLDGDVLDFFWDFGDGQTATGSRVVHQYANQTDYDALLTVHDNSGQVGNSSVQRFKITVNKPPHAEAGSDVVAAFGDAVKLDGAASGDQDGVIKRYLWDLRDVRTLEGSAISHIYAKPGKYPVALRVEDDSDSPCNFDTDSVLVWINAPPQAEAGENVINPAGKQIRFDGSGSLDSDGEIVSYAWNFGDGETGAGKIASHGFKKPGTYAVTLTIKDNANVKNSVDTDQLAVIINHPPVAQAGQDIRVADGETVNFDGALSNDQDGKIINYLWNFGDGNTAPGARASHTYQSPGTYAVALTVKDNSGTDSDVDVDSMVVIVNAAPNAEAGENQVVTRSEVKFDAIASKDSDGKIVRYHWDFGDDQSSTEAAPLHVYSKTGTYGVKLTVTDDSNTRNNQTSDVLQIVVNQNPIADSGPDQSAAAGQEVILDGKGSFDPDGSVSRYAWDFGDGQSASGQRVTHRYSKPGVYPARLTVEDDTGHANAIDYDEAIIIVNAPPVAVAGSDRIAAPGQNIQLDGRGSYDPDGKIISYRWDFSDGQGAVEAAPAVRKFNTPGVYTAQLTVKDDSNVSSATARDTIFIRINNAPIAHAGSNLVTCETSVAFDAAASTDADGDPLTYYWDFGDGSPPDSGIQVIHRFAKGGAYPIILTVDDGLGLLNSKNSTAITARINEPPVANAGENKTLCAGDVVIFNAGNSKDPEGGLLRYRWEFGDGTSADGLNPTKIYKNGGVYKVKLTVEDDSGLPCNSASDTKVVRVIESPVAVAGPDITVCANKEVKFDGTPSRDSDGVVNSYFWDFGDGTTGGGATPIKVYNRAGTYRVVLTITGDLIGECDNTDTDEVLVTVYEAPIAKFSSPPSSPVNLPVRLDASESSSEGAKIISYQWDFGDGTTGNGKIVTHTYTRSGRLLATLSIKTDTNTDCNVTTAQRLVIMNEPPTADAGAEQIIGAGQVALFDGSASKDADGSVVSYSWAFGDGETAAGAQVRHKFQKSGRFPAVLMVKDDAELANSSASDTVWVTVNHAPKAVMAKAAQACAGEQVALSAAPSVDPDGKIIAYRWNFGDGKSAEGAQTTHAYQNPGLYHVTLTVDDGTPTDNRRSEIAETIFVNTPPAASGGKDQIVCPGSEVSFDASASIDGDGQITQYRWNFGDGHEQEGKVVKHRYEKAGRYHARLTVVDDTHTKCAAKEDTVVVTVNASPVADAGLDKQGFVGGAHDAILFDGTRSSDPDGEALTYSWDFGDGATKPGAKVFHTYVKPGTYLARLKVTDGRGTACSVSVDEVKVEIRERGGMVPTRKN